MVASTTFLILINGRGNKSQYYPGIHGPNESKIANALIGVVLRDLRQEPIEFEEKTGSQWKTNGSYLQPCTSIVE